MEPLTITNIIIETLRALVVGFILVTAVSYGRSHHINKKGGWRFIISGFGFLFFGMLVDISDIFPALNRFVIIGNTIGQAYTEKIVGYVFGFGFLAIGFWKWLPKVNDLDRAKKELETMNDSLEVLIEMRTEEINHLYQKLQKKNDIIQHELNVAGAIQRGIMPRHVYEWNGYRAMGFSMPMEKVGGDFFDFIPLSDDRFVIYIADVSGHGIPAALITTMLKISIATLSQKFTDPAEIVKNLNQRLQVINQIEESVLLNYLTLFIAVINRDGNIDYANCGHHLPIYYSGEMNQITEMSPSKGSIIGAFDDRLFTIQPERIVLRVEDKLLIYTDGIIEKTNRDHLELGREGLTKAFQEGINEGLEGETLLQYVFVHFNEFSDGLPNRDDITLILLEKISGE